MASRVAGVLRFKINGIQRNAKGNWTYNLGVPEREEVMGPDGFHGYKELPKAAKVEGEITDQSDLDLMNDIFNLVDATITLELANGKTAVFQEATYGGSGDIQTEDANVAVKFFARKGEEILP